MKLIFSNQKYQSSSLFLEPKNFPIGFQLNTLNENQFYLTTTNLTNRIEEHKSNNIGKQTKKLIKIDEIDKLLTFEKILKYGINAIKLKDDYLFDRIRKLKELCDSEEDYDVSLESLKAMFLFIGSIGNISKPSSLTVSESGIFYLKWQRDRKNSITVRFKDDYFSDYVIFKPSLHTDKRIILNGSMNVMDLIDYLNNLNIKIYQAI